MDTIYTSHIKNVTKRVIATKNTYDIPTNSSLSYTNNNGDAGEYNSFPILRAHPND